MDSFNQQLLAEWVIGCLVVLFVLIAKNSFGIKCYECDGRGWMYLDEFLDRDGEELLGETPPRYFVRNFGEPFEIGICPFCDGLGKERKWLKTS